MIDPQEFRHVLGRFASGVTVVTVMNGDEPHGITVSAFMSVSLVPPLIAISIGRNAKAHDLLSPGRHFGVSILRQGQEEISDLFASRPVTIPNPLQFSEGFNFVRGSLGRLLCRVTDSLKAGDHTIFVGEVERLSYDEGQPLVYHRGRYMTVGELDLTD